MLLKRRWKVWRGERIWGGRVLVCVCYMSESLGFPRVGCVDVTIFMV